MSRLAFIICKSLELGLAMPTVATLIREGK